MSSRFNYVKRGYDPAEVDAYIETMEAVIKSYKEKDAAIKNAILNAQIAADGIILNAKNQSKEIKEKALLQVMEIKESVSTQKTMLKDFQDEYNQLINKYMHTVNNHDIGAVKEKINSLEKYLDKFSDNKDHVSGAAETKMKAEGSKVSSEEKKALIG